MHHDSMDPRRAAFAAMSPSCTCHVLYASRVTAAPRARGSDALRAVRAPVSGSFRDVRVSGEFRKLGGPPGGGYGLILRDQSPAPLDGITQMFGLRESTWVLRVITGTLFGLGNIWFVLPLIQKTLDETPPVQRPAAYTGMYPQPQPQTLILDTTPDANTFVDHASTR